MKDKERLENLLRRDKAVISEECEEAAVRDFAHVAEEYFELALFVVCETMIMYIQDKLGRSRERMQQELPNIF